MRVQCFLGKMKLLFFVVSVAVVVAATCQSNMPTQTKSAPYLNPSRGSIAPAAALAANAQFDKAAETAGKAIKIAKSTGQNERVRNFQNHLNLYKTRQTLRE